LNSPADGWVTTTFCPAKILPLPTGIALVAASASAAALAGALLAGALLAAALLAAALLGPAAGEVVPAAGVLAAGVLPLAPQAVTAPARPSRPTPASMVRRVAAPPGTDVSACASCVIAAPIHISAAADADEETALTLSVLNTGCEPLRFSHRIFRAFSQAGCRQFAAGSHDSGE